MKKASFKPEVGQLAYFDNHTTVGESFQLVKVTMVDNYGAAVVVDASGKSHVTCVSKIYALPAHFLTA